MVPGPIDSANQSPVPKKEGPSKLAGSGFSAIGQQSLNKSRMFGDAVLNSNIGNSYDLQSGGYDVNKKSGGYDVNKKFQPPAPNPSNNYQLSYKLDTKN